VSLRPTCRPLDARRRVHWLRKLKKCPWGRCAVKLSINRPITWPEEEAPDHEYSRPLPPAALTDDIRSHAHPCRECLCACCSLTVARRRPFLSCHFVLCLRAGERRLPHVDPTEEHSFYVRSLNLTAFRGRCRYQRNRRVFRTIVCGLVMNAAALRVAPGHEHITLIHCHEHITLINCLLTCSPSSHALYVSLHQEFGY
jgi:hypothetical protein